MRRELKTAVLAVLLIASATACTRRVQVESEPSRTEAPADTTDRVTPRR